MSKVRVRAQRLGRIGLRLRRDEVEMVRAAAHLEGETVSGWVRPLLRRAARRALRPAKRRPVRSGAT